MVLTEKDIIAIILTETDEFRLDNAVISKLTKIANTKSDIAFRKTLNTFMTDYDCVKEITQKVYTYKQTILRTELTI